MAATDSSTALQALRENGFNVPALLDCQKYPPPSRSVVSDKETPNLQAIIGTTGSIGFYARPSLAGKQVRRFLGEFSPNETPGKRTYQSARRWTRRLTAAAEKGLDAFGAESAELADNLGRAVEPERPTQGDPAETVEAVAGAFYRLKATGPNKVERPEKIESALRNDIVPTLGALQFSDVTPKLCANLVEAVVARGAPVHAGTVFGILGHLCKYAVTKGIIDRNPCADLIPSLLGVSQGGKGRPLCEAEIPLVWYGLDFRVPGQQGLAELTKLALRLLMLVPTRSGELLQAAKDEFDLDGGLWRVPEGHQKEKGRGPFDQPLSVPATVLLRRMFDLTKGSPLVLGGMSDKCLSHAMRGIFAPQGDRPAYVALPGHPKRGNQPPTPHDFRHTFASLTLSSGLTEDKLLIEACLNHADGFRYQQGDAFKSRSQLLAKWAGYVAGLLGGLRAIRAA